MSWRSGTLIRRIREDIDPRGDAERAAFERAYAAAEARTHREAMDEAWRNRPSVRRARSPSRNALLAVPAFLRRQALAQVRAQQARRPICMDDALCSLEQGHDGPCEPYTDED